MRRFCGFIVVLCALALAGGALAVVGGTPDTTHTYVGGAIQVQMQNGVPGHELCTGFLIGPTTFVTAAHCFDPNGEPILVTFGSSVLDPEADFVEGTVVNNPSFCVDCGKGGTPVNDVALITLSDPQPGPYAQLPPLGFDDNLPRKQAVDVVGYGVQSFEKKVAAAFGSRQIAVTRTKNVNGAKGDIFLKLEGAPGACFGDSGGPDLQSGTDVVLAINTFGKGATCKDATFSQRLDLPAVQAFIYGTPLPPPPADSGHGHGHGHGSNDSAAYSLG